MTIKHFAYLVSALLLLYAGRGGSSRAGAASKSVDKSVLCANVLSGICQCHLESLEWKNRLTLDSPIVVEDI